MLTLSILFLALLFILGLITTLLRFPAKKFQSWIYSHSLKSLSQSQPVVNNSNSSSAAMTTQRRSSSSSNNHNKLELRSIFATFDKNNDGYITKQELKQSLKNIGILMEDADIADMVEKVDSNKDGLIDVDEFYELCHSFLGIEGIEEEEEEEESRDRNLKEAFDVFDDNKDGLISVEELSKVLSSLGLNQGKRLEDCKEMIRKIDVDGDGRVNFDEFKKMMKAGGRLVQIT